MNETIRHWTTAVGFISLAGCGAARPPPPGFSATAYEAEAASEQREADAELGLFKPDAADYNPTQKHLAEAERHQDAAARFRAKSQDVRDAEAIACAGLFDSDTSSFAHTEDLIGLEPPVVPSQDGAFQWQGAVFTFPALSGMTAQWPSRVMDCNVARYDAMGHVAPRHARPPARPRRSASPLGRDRTTKQIG